MSDIAELVKQGKFEEALALPEGGLEPRERFFRVSSLLSLGKAQAAMDEILAHRKNLFDAHHLLTIKADEETRLLLNQYDEAEQDVAYFQNLPYVSQRVEEALRALPSTIAATRFTAGSNSRKDLEELLEVLASPSDDLMLLSALNGLKKVGELEDYRGLVEELLLGPHHDDVKTYALMLLSAKGSDHPVTLVKGGKRYEVIPAKLGTPYGLPEYQALRRKLGALLDQSLVEVSGELLDLYALIRYPERFLTPGEEDDFFEGLVDLGRSYLGQNEGELSEKAKQYRETIASALAENPPLLG